MVLVRKNGEDEWGGYLIDGYIPSLKKLRNTYGEVHNPKPSQLNMEGLARDELFVSSMFNIMVKYCKKVFRENPNLLIENGGRLQHKNYCDSYLLRLHKGRLVEMNEKSKIIRNAYLQLQREFDFERNKKDYRQILLFSHYCPEPENCINKTIEKLDFRIKRPKEYEDIEEFEESCRWLLQEKGLSAFLCPCGVVEERLKKMDFECTRP